MPAKHYKQAYETAKRDLVARLKKRAQLDHEIRALVDTLKPLAALCQVDLQEIDDLFLNEGLAIDPGAGFTGTIRRIFHARKTPLNPPEIRDELLKLGVGREQVNLLSSIHTVLRRMVAGGELKKNTDSSFSLVHKI